MSEKSFARRTARAAYEEGREEERARIVKLIDEDLAFYAQDFHLDVRERQLVDTVLRALFRSIERLG